MSAPTFSVIVAAYESAGRIPLTLRSVLGQSRSDLELVVVDDGSEDETAEVVERMAQRDARLRLIRQSNRGTAGARNRGIEDSRGRYLSFLDDDDFWLPTYLERVGAALAADPSAGVGFCDAWVLDASSGRVGSRSALERFARPIRRLPERIASSEALPALLRVNFLTTCATTVTREALEVAGPLDPSIRGADDWDLWLRIVGEGFGMARVPERLAVLGKRPDSVGADARMMAANSARTLQAALERGPGASAERVARRHLQAVELERRSLGSGRRSRLARLARRIGRKRLPALRSGDEWVEAPATLRAELARLEGEPAGPRPRGHSSR